MEKLSGIKDVFVGAAKMGVVGPLAVIFGGLAGAGEYSSYGMAKNNFDLGRCAREAAATSDPMMDWGADICKSGYNQIKTGFQKIF